MAATVEIENTATGTSVLSVTPVVSATPAPVRPSDVLVGHDAARERELDTVVASIEGAAEGLAVFLLLAMFGLAFVVATLTGVFA